MTEPETIQRIQSQLGKMQYTYPNERVEFWAIAPAWEAVRVACAKRVVAGDLDTAQDKLIRVKDALADCEKSIADRRTRRRDIAIR